MPSLPTLHDPKGKHTEDSGTCSDTDVDETACARKSGDFPLLKRAVLIPLETGVLPIKSLLRLEGTTPKAGRDRIILSTYGLPWSLISP